MKPLKRILCSTLIMSILLSVSVFAVSASNNELYQTKTYVINIEDEIITFDVQENDKLRTVSYIESGQYHVVIYDLVSGVLKMDGMIISQVSGGLIRDEMVINSQNHVSAPNTEFTWVHYDTKHGDVTSTVITTAGWYATLLGLVGVAVPILLDIATELASEFIPTIYYKKLMYYKSPILTSRPQTSNVFEFYADPEYKELLYTVDHRPAL